MDKYGDPRLRPGKKTQLNKEGRFHTLKRLKKNKNRWWTKDRTVKREGGMRQTESRWALWLALPFRLKPEQRATHTGFWRMRKWNVYSKGADKWGRWRCWRALVQTVAFTHRRAAANIKQSKLCTLQCNLPHLYINQTPTILIQHSPLISTLICLLKQQCFCSNDCPTTT